MDYNTLTNIQETNSLMVYQITVKRKIIRSLAKVYSVMKTYIDVNNVSESTQIDTNSEIINIVNGN